MTAASDLEAAHLAEAAHIQRNTVRVLSVGSVCSGIAVAGSR